MRESMLVAGGVKSRLIYYYYKSMRYSVPNIEDIIDNKTNQSLLIQSLFCFLVTLLTDDEVV